MKIMLHLHNTRAYDATQIFGSCTISEYNKDNNSNRRNKHRKIGKREAEEEAKKVNVGERMIGNIFCCLIPLHLPSYREF